ncbi:alpha/beta hydrolase [Actinocorallia longicatena]|uniref:Alpha/beta hydrolase-fold protein n=1 Tax=Actinocorallia longicatena TaxID=111803 RepID=A0ABP6PVR1_9ACTN
MAVSRRAVLLGGVVGAAGAAGVVGGGYFAVDSGLLPGRARFRRALGLTGEDGVVPNAEPVPTRTVRRFSKARGTEISMIAMAPPGAKNVCVALHGGSAEAGYWLDLGLPRFLGAAFAAGVPPFAVVAVDGGRDSYWHELHQGDDPQLMLVKELPAWLSRMGLAPPSLALGISMGGSGALQYARLRGGTLKGVAAVSPALFPTWKDSTTVGAYADQADWAAHEPLNAAGPVAGHLGVWCGTDDPFYKPARALSGAEHTSFTPGLHSIGYWRRVLPDVLTFLGGAL